MQISRKEGALVTSNTTEIESVYQHALAQTENQKRALVAAVLSSCGASEFFNQDLDEVSGGVR